MLAQYVQQVSQSKSSAVGGFLTVALQGDNADDVKRNCSTAILFTFAHRAVTNAPLWPDRLPGGRINSFRERYRKAIVQPASSAGTILHDLPA